jgi:diguanylate cyclase (GGDEF)-like protein
MTNSQRKNELRPLALNDDSLWSDDGCKELSPGMEVGSFIQYLAEAVLIVSPDGVIECANAKAALLLNCVDKPLIGQQWPEFLMGRCQQQYQGLVKMVAKRVLSLQAGVVIIDIDFFKHFNDRYGHIQGDACLRKVAGAIVQAMPVDAKLAARYGGEEFALILPHHNEIMALQVAREVQQAVRQLQFTDAGLPATLSVSVSQGIATEINGQYRTSMALLCAADTALYRAKADGRDCINASC